MRIFVAGATGVVGRRVVPLLLADGHAVVGLARSTGSAERIRAMGADAVVGDAMDAAAVRAAVESARPDVVMHQLTDLAGADFAGNSALRVHGTRHLADAAAAAGARRFIAQSIAWAYAPGEEPADEDVPLDPTTDQPRRTTVDGVAALERETARAPEWVVLRYGLLYGPGTWYWTDGAMADRARTGELPATADVASFVHVDDAAVAAVQALSWPTGAVNVCDDEPAAGTEWTPAFCRAVGAPEPPRSDRRAAFARGADSAHARHDLGWRPRWTTWREGFAAMS
ncbi:MAG TPA: NAD(P)-dependent oxidoreductase [Pseudonocardiaceae bacterium]|nr:NAD(P)-dependent oxidoreductase [Pseudonocardiaceae bacterium]